MIGIGTDNQFKYYKHETMIVTQFSIMKSMITGILISPVTKGVQI
ncbi:hypothetical protein M132_3604 [Bacteroides fragilis str. S24L15]|nr:hypothetical protein M132_3604 [Bacteroides fragilis str. S24L15]